MFRTVRETTGRKNIKTRTSESCWEKPQTQSRTAGACVHKRHPSVPSQNQTHPTKKTIKRSFIAVLRSRTLTWLATLPIQTSIGSIAVVATTKIKSNDFYCHITTAHVPWWVKFLRACSRQCRNNLHIDSIYLQTYTEDNVQNTHTYTPYTQCTIRHTVINQ